MASEEREFAEEGEDADGAADPGGTKTPLVFPPETCHGALVAYITEAEPRHFQPMNINFGLLPPPEGKIRDKKRRKEMLAERALASLKNFQEGLD